MSGDIEPADIRVTGDLQPAPVEIVAKREVDLATATAAFLVGYRGATRANHATSLRMWFRWCSEHRLAALVDPTRHHIEAYGLELDEVRRLRPSSVAQRLGSVILFYRHLYESGLSERDPAAGVRRPRVPVDSTAPHVDAQCLARLLRTAEPNPTAHLLICLLGLMGLRVSEAIGAQITGLGVIGDRRVITIARKGGKRQTLPLPPAVAGAIDRAVGRRTEGPLLLWGYWREPMSRSQAYRIVKRLAAEAGLDRRVHAHALRHAFVTIALDSGQPLQSVQASAGHNDARTTMRYDRNRLALERNVSGVVTDVVLGALEPEEGDPEGRGQGSTG